MDKEAQEKIAELPFPGEEMFARLNYQVALMSPARGSVIEAYRLAQQDMLEAGYRKLPEGKPPLLSELEPDVDASFGQEVCCDILPRYLSVAGRMSGECYEQIVGLAYNLAYVIAEAQRDSDWEWFKGQ